MRKRKKLWVLMYKKVSEEESIWIYEPLRMKEISAKQKHGWRVVK